MPPKRTPEEEAKLKEVTDKLQAIVDGCKKYDLEQFQAAFDVWNALNRENREHAKRAEEK
jgi:hypothetical protein